MTSGVALGIVAAGRGTRTCVRAPLAALDHDAQAV